MARRLSGSKECGWRQHAAKARLRTPVRSGVRIILLLHKDMACPAYNGQRPCLISSRCTWPALEGDHDTYGHSPRSPSSPMVTKPAVCEHQSKVAGCKLVSDKTPTFPSLSYAMAAPATAQRDTCCSAPVGVSLQPRVVSTVKPGTCIALSNVVAMGRCYRLYRGMFTQLPTLFADDIS